MSFYLDADRVHGDRRSTVARSRKRLTRRSHGSLRWRWQSLLSSWRKSEFPTSCIVDLVRRQRFWPLAGWHERRHRFGIFCVHST